MSDDQTSRGKRLLAISVLLALAIVAYRYREPVVWAVKYELVGEGTMRDSDGPIALKYYRNRFSTSVDVSTLTLSDEQKVVATVVRNVELPSEWSFDLSAPSEKNNEEWLRVLASRAWQVVLDPAALDKAMRPGGDPRILFWAE